MEEPGASAGMGCHDDSDGTAGGLDHSIRPDVPCPESVLVLATNGGGYLLVGYPQGEPAAFIAAVDAAPMRETLAAAFKAAPLASPAVSGGQACRDSRN